MDHSHHATMDHSHMDHGDMPGHDMPMCSMNVSSISRARVLVSTKKIKVLKKH
jgi:hypothetical protein